MGSSIRLVVLALALAACSEDSDPSALVLRSISVPDFGSWESNRPIEFTFDQRIDFASVSGDSIRIRTSAGVPAAGTFAAKAIDANGDGAPDGADDRVIVFYPSCPVAGDLSDAGFTPGVRYVLGLPGEDSSQDPASLLRSRSGTALAHSIVQAFETVADLAATLHDEKPGAPPLPVVRARGAHSGGACHLELGDDPSNQVYFEAEQELGRTPAGFAAPLNLFGDHSTRVSFVVVFDQVIHETPENLARLRLEYGAALDTAGWTPLERRVELVSNCHLGNAIVRLVPLGTFPAGGFVRVRIEPGFEDVVGEGTLEPLERFAVAEIEAPAFASLEPSGAIADEIREEFDFGEGSPLSFVDPEAQVGVAGAEWGGGELRSGLGIEALPPELADFDWVVGPREAFDFDTESQTVLGGPNGEHVKVQTSTGGLVLVRNFVVEAGGVLRARGPNPLVIHATGSVSILGRIDVNGSDAADRRSPGIGGAGGPGGGPGGSGTSGVDARGGAGSGPAGTEAGGNGGESSFSPVSPGPLGHLGAGGGGGRFGRNQGFLVAEAGSNGSDVGRGAESGASPARGGAPGSGPFGDADPENDFFGVAPIVDSLHNLVGVRRGELAGPHGGEGGGGGGDLITSSVFPPSAPVPVTEGGGGGGGGGVLVIRATDRIRFGLVGQIVANGGKGARGRGIATHGGSGSGGHVILESAKAIDFTDGNPGVPPRLWIRAAGGPRASQGGGGPNFGGAGGPGVVQLHVPRPELAPGTDSGVILPEFALTQLDPLSEVSEPRPSVLFATMGKVSGARSRWIPLGAAGEETAGAPASGVAFRFDGIETAPGPDEGRVKTVGERVAELPPLLGPASLALPEVTLRANGFTLALRGSILAPLRESGGAIGPDVYLRRPALLAGMTLRLANAGDPARESDLSIAAARYDDRRVVLELDLAGTSGTLRETVDELGGPEAVELTLVPRFFQVRQGLAGRDVLPDSRSVRILFQGAADDGTGRPDEEHPLVDWTADVTRFGALPPGTLDFVRFQVEFDLDALDRGFDPLAEPIALEFLRLPFRF